MNDPLRAAIAAKLRTAFVPFMNNRNSTTEQYVDSVAGQLAALTAPPAVPGPSGYLLAADDGHGRLVADWDGVIHPTRDSADGELAEANDPDDHQHPPYLVYEVHPAEDQR